LNLSFSFAIFWFANEVVVVLSLAFGFIIYNQARRLYYLPKAARRLLNAQAFAGRQ